MIGSRNLFKHSNNTNQKHKNNDGHRDGGGDDNDGAKRRNSIPKGDGIKMQEKQRNWILKQRRNPLYRKNMLAMAKDNHDSSKNIQNMNMMKMMTSPNSKTNRLRRMFMPLILSLGLTFLRLPPQIVLPAFAMGGAAGGSTKPIVPMKRDEVISSISLFSCLFITLALLHAAEIAITTLYPWKVREFAEEEEKQNTGGRGVFKILNEDITRVLTTILVTSTACSIYGKILV